MTWIGDFCEKGNPCYPNPCSHGSCIPDGKHFTCKCAPGYGGNTCSDTDYCFPNPCLNNGKCQLVGQGSYKCTCQKGYLGSTCSRKDVCHPSPCGVHGVCHANRKAGTVGTKTTPTSLAVMATRKSIDEFQCTCHPGFRGAHCSDLDPCTPSPCQHGAKCTVDDKGSHKCLCKPGYKGIYCADVDLCNPNPCSAEKSCIQTDPESFRCVKSKCQPNPCQNKGTCKNVAEDAYQCTCSKGWSGNDCQVWNPCTPNPCKNNGVCRGGEDGKYTCDCTAWYEGEHCDKSLQRRDKVAVTGCRDNPCQFGGTCHSTTLGIYCKCNMAMLETSVKIRRVLIIRVAMEAYACLITGWLFASVNQALLGLTVQLPRTQRGLRFPMKETK